jgi:hypothetical protein
MVALQSTKSGAPTPGRVLYSEHRMAFVSWKQEISGKLPEFG